MIPDPTPREEPYEAHRHLNHRGHWDKQGGGDWHCSEHRDPDCACGIVADNDPTDEPPGAGADYWNRPSHATHPEYWTE